MIARAVEVREVLTPQGLPLRFRIASFAERVGAVIQDLFALFLFLVLWGLICVFIGVQGSRELALILAILGTFFLRNGYFIFHEIRSRGRTPGKKATGLRVVDRNGGPLRTEAIFVRNLMREIELFMPLMVLLSPDGVFPGARAWMALVGGAWVLAFALMPLFNAERLRVGDLLAGTMVVKEPAGALLADLSEESASVPWMRFSFTPEQLSHYGVFELQTLEEVLRTGATDADGCRKIADRIMKKIRWPKERRSDPAEPFLRSFYDAQRKHLEGRLLMGQRKERKDS